MLRDLKFLDYFSSIMFDDTHSSFDQNITNSISYRKFLEASGKKKILEGCLEEVAAGGKGLVKYTGSIPNKIYEYLLRTGFHLVVPNVGTESITARTKGIEWDILDQLKKGMENRLVIHGFSSISKLPIEDQQRLGHLGVVAMNAFSYIPQEICSKILHRTSAMQKNYKNGVGYPISFDSGGNPIFPNDIETKDANVFFGPALDYLRDLQVDMIATSTYDILNNLGYSRLGT